MAGTRRILRVDARSTETPTAARSTETPTTARSTKTPTAARATGTPTSARPTAERPPRSKTPALGSLPRPKPSGRGPKRPYNIPLTRAAYDMNQPIYIRWVENSTLPIELKNVISKRKNADLPEPGTCLIVAWIKKLKVEDARKRMDNGAACETPCKLCAQRGSVCVQVKDEATVTVLNSLNAAVDAETQRRCNEDNEARGVE